MTRSVASYRPGSYRLGGLVVALWLLGLGGGCGSMSFGEVCRARCEEAQKQECLAERWGLTLEACRQRCTETEPLMELLAGRSGCTDEYETAIACWDRNLQEIACGDSNPCISEEEAWEDCAGAFCESHPTDSACSEP